MLNSTFFYIVLMLILMNMINCTAWHLIYYVKICQMMLLYNYITVIQWILFQGCLFSPSCKSYALEILRSLMNPSWDGKCAELLWSAAERRIVPECTLWECWRLVWLHWLLWRNCAGLVHRWRLSRSSTSRNHWWTPEDTQSTRVSDVCYESVILMCSWRIAHLDSEQIIHGGDDDVDRRVVSCLCSQVVLKVWCTDTQLSSLSEQVELHHTLNT